MQIMVKLGLPGEADRLAGRFTRRLRERGEKKHDWTPKQVPGEQAITFKGNTFFLNPFPSLEIMEDGGHLLLRLMELEPLVQSL